MTWLLWQQQRRQVLAVALALVVVAVFLGITGAHLAATYHAAVRSCATSPGGCGDLSQTLFQGDNRLFDIVDATGFLLPFVLGLFWGAPLVAKEVEEGTHRLAWTQSITRLGWLTVKLGCVLGAAVGCAGALSALMTWWYSPVNAVQLNRLGSVIFDTQGLVPVGYALFAVALGATTGVLVRRTLPAMATTLVTFGVVRYVVDEYLRPHLLPARSVLVNMTTAFGNNPAGVGSWVLGGSYLNGAGKVLPRDKPTLATSQRRAGRSTTRTTRSAGA